MQTPNEAQNGKIVMWVLGLLGTLTIISLQYLVITRVDSLDNRIREAQTAIATVVAQVRNIEGLDTRIRDNATTIAKLQEKLSQVDTLMSMTRQEQVTRTSSLSELNARLTALELALKLQRDRTPQ